MKNPPTGTFLDWIADRFVNRHDESNNVDFVQRLRREAVEHNVVGAALSENEDFYHLVKVGGPHMDGTWSYQIRRIGQPGGFGGLLYMTDKQAEDLGNQLEAPVLMFTDLDTSTDYGLV